MLCTNEYVVTHVSKSVQLCERCQSFGRSMMINRGTHGSCKHTSLLSDLITELLHPEDSRLQSAFCHWFALQRQLSFPVVELNVHGATRIYLTITSQLSTLTPRHRVSICSVRNHGQTHSVRCNSVDCSKGKNKLTHNIKNVDEDVCIHLKLLLESGFIITFTDNDTQHPPPSDNEESCWSGASESECAEEKIEENNNFGVWWDQDSAKWLPADCCSVSPIPLRPTIESIEWSHRRRMGKFVDMKSDGTLQGPPLAPKCCSSCSIGLTHDKHQTTIMRLHTRIGTVYRELHVCQCPQCGKNATWSAAEECIHFVSSGRDAGLLCFTLFHGLYICLRVINGLCHLKQSDMK
jgi:hypothetical protein